jgi:hypothetical protein
MPNKAPQLRGHKKQKIYQARREQDLNLRGRNHKMTEHVIQVLPINHSGIATDVYPKIHLFKLIRPIGNMRAGVAKRAYYIGYTSFPMPGLKSIYTEFGNPI